MANILFPAIPHTKLKSWMFKSVIGMKIPKKSKTNTGNVGLFVDEYIKSQLDISDLSTTVDLNNYGVEIKTKNVYTNSDWSIGSMTLEDIINTPYRESSVYQKLQGLLLITTDDTLQVIKDLGLYYFDFDEVQILLEKSYEDCRTQIKERVKNHANNVVTQIAAGNINAVLSTVQFSSFEKFQGGYGKFEFTNNGTSFMFRISVSQMRHLTTLTSSQTTLYNFE